MTWWHKIALGTVPVVGVVLCLLLFQISAALPRIVSDIHGMSGEGVVAFQSVSETTKSANTLVQAATKRVDALTSTQTKLNTGIDLLTHRLTDLCPAAKAVGLQIHPCGLIADADKTLNTARGTLGQVEVAARSFDQHQSVFYQQEADLAAKTEDTVGDLDRFLKSPDIIGTLRNLNTSSAALASTANHADAVAGDIQFEADKIAHPPKKKLGIWGGIWAGAQVIHKLSPPLF